MSDGLILFMAMVGVAVFLLSQGVVAPVFGNNGKVRRRLQHRLDEIEAASGEESYSSLLRGKYLRGLSPTERWLESLPGMESARSRHRSIRPHAARLPPDPDARSD